MFMHLLRLFQELCTGRPYALCHFLPGKNFHGPNFVLEGIVSVYLFDAEVGIGVA
jgi:hypothetical protein